MFRILLTFSLLLSSALAAQPPSHLARQEHVRGVYMTFWSVGNEQLRAGVLKTVADAHLNAVVIDVKGDLGLISHRTKLPLAIAVGAARTPTIKDAPALLADLHNRGIYAIARIVCFKDNPLAHAQPALAVKTATGGLFVDREGLAWTDPFNLTVQDYNIAIAVEAAEEGFDEVQFDYVRFPDHAGLTFSKPNTEANRTAAIDSFLTRARAKLKEHSVALSADHFGYVCWNRNDTGIGQTLTGIGAAVDFLSPMLYPSGFRAGIPGFKNPITNPYAIIFRSLAKAKERTGYSPAVFRPWLQAFSDYAFDHRQFGEAELAAQISAAETFGANGWLLWEPRNRYPTEVLTRLSKRLWLKNGTLSAHATPAQ